MHWRLMNKKKGSQGNARMQCLFVSVPIIQKMAPVAPENKRSTNEPHAYIAYKLEVDNVATPAILMGPPVPNFEIK